ncbi:FecR family protein [Sphingobacterium olei]|uniref:FecR family protein n=1 Tax=Sphingobacterium olei TaxID=2571155 RepID=A0A4U0NKB8_9SPHI|nr:FecR family protein [Sphingobacterium olei]TJZ54795.1 FecR family protein [Sphingobacterium olei]
MKFGKNKRNDQDDRLEQHQVRKKIWEAPSIIEDIFPDKDWQLFEGNPLHDHIPSAKMAKHIEEEIHKETEQQERNERRSHSLQRFTRYTAAAVILVLLSFNLWRWVTPNPDAVIPSYVEQHEKPVQDSSWISVTNDKQGIQTLTLPDQSTIKLFAQTTVRYLRNFPGDSREIYLDGKAYFSVTKDADRPFSVYTGETKTTALGTSFTIDTRTNSRYTSVQLHTGKVVVASLAAIPAFENVFLNNSGERLSFDTNMRIIEHKRGHAKKTTLPPTPTIEKNTVTLLQMDNIPLPNVFVALTTAYNTPIKIGEQGISKILYTGNIDPQRETLEEVLAVICLINNLRYVTETDGSYTIYSQDKGTKEEHKNENL